jgi:hyperosmotically inducible periplasmic protein
MRMRIPVQIAAYVMTALLFTVGQAKAADTPDAWLTAKAKVALMTTEGIRTTHLNVDTVNGVVTLHGQVPKADQKTKAAEVVRKLDGVKEVKNLLQVVPSAQRKAVKRSDDEIKKDLDAQWKSHKGLNDSGIKVESVNDGVVLLSGKTKSHAAYLESVEIADAVHGVKRVSSEVVLEPSK